MLLLVVKKALMLWSLKLRYYSDYFFSVLFYGTNSITLRVVAVLATSRSTSFAASSTSSNSVKRLVRLHAAVQFHYTFKQLYQATLKLKQ
jgi:hypothetical protein